MSDAHFTHPFSSVPLRGFAGSLIAGLARTPKEIGANPDVRAVYLDDERLTLTPKEYRLLQILAQHAGNVVTHQHLLKDVWGQQHINDTHYLRIFVRKLRQKIEADPNRPRILVTELGVGYRLAMPTEVFDKAPH